MLPAAHHEEVCKVPSSYRAGTNLSMHDLILVYSECAQKSRRLCLLSKITVQFFLIRSILNQLLKALNHRLFVFLIGNSEPFVLCFTSSLPLSHSTSLLRCLLLTTERCAKFRAATVQGHIYPCTTLFYSTVTLFARFRGLSTSSPFATLT